MKFIAVLILSSALAGCGARSSDEERLRELLANMEKAAESRDASDVLEHVADGYSDSNGNDRGQLQNFLRGYFLANPRVEVVLDIESLELPVPGLAKAQIDVMVLPANDRASLDVEFRQQDGEWRVFRADRAEGAR